MHIWSSPSMSKYDYRFVVASRLPATLQRGTTLGRVEFARVRHPGMYLLWKTCRINSERKANSEDNAWTCSARPAKVRRKRNQTYSPKCPLRCLGAPKAPLWVFGQGDALQVHAPGPGVGFAF